jgi:hypothetical protein
MSTETTIAKINQEQLGEWFFLAWCSPYTGRWMGLAKREAFTVGVPFREPGDVWFKYGSSREDALHNIKMSVLS